MFSIHNFGIILRNKEARACNAGCFILDRPTSVFADYTANGCFAAQLFPGKNNGPQFRVNPCRSTVERARLGEDEMAWSGNGKFQDTPSSVHAKWLA